MWTKFVNNIFVVNLADRTERLQQAKEQLDRFGIDYTVWVATKNEDGRKGLVETMRQLFEHCLEMGYERVAILEDDFKIIPTSFNEYMENCVAQLPEYFDLFYMGCNLSGKCTRYSENLLSATGLYSSHAIIYQKKTIEKILPLLDDSEAYDITLATKIQPEGGTFCSYPLLVTQKTGFSDIKNMVVNYDKIIDNRYNQKTKEL